MLARPTAGCGGGCIWASQATSAPRRRGCGAGRSATVGGYVGVPCYVGFLTVWCGSWDVVPVCVRCVCACVTRVFLCMCVCVCVCCPQLSPCVPAFLLGVAGGEARGAAQGPPVTESVSVEEGDKREDENAAGREKWRAGVGAPGEGTMRAEGMRGEAGRGGVGARSGGVPDKPVCGPPRGRPPGPRHPALGGPDTSTPAPVRCTRDSISSARG